MLGGHQAKAMPIEILTDPRMTRCQRPGPRRRRDPRRRAARRPAHPRGPARRDVAGPDPEDTRSQAAGLAQAHHLAPDIDALPFVDRRFLAQDPLPTDGRMRGEHGRRPRLPLRLLVLRCRRLGQPRHHHPHPPPGQHPRRDGRTSATHGVTAFRFVDDLFLGARRVIDQMMAAFTADRVGDWAVWDATGPHQRPAPRQRRDSRHAGRQRLREVALGIESGSDRMLELHRQAHRPPT